MIKWFNHKQITVMFWLLVCWRWFSPHFTFLECFDPQTTDVLCGKRSHGRHIFRGQRSVRNTAVTKPELNLGLLICWTLQGKHQSVNITSATLRQTQSQISIEYESAPDDWQSDIHFPCCSAGKSWAPKCSTSQLLPFSVVIFRNSLKCIIEPGHSEISHEWVHGVVLTIKRKSTNRQSVKRTAHAHASWGSIMQLFFGWVEKGNLA